MPKSIPITCNHVAAGFAIHPATHRKGYHVVTIEGDGSGFKTEAAAFVEAQGGQWVGRYHGYVVPDSKVVGILGGLRAVMPGPYQFIIQFLDFVLPRNGTTEGMDCATLHKFRRQAEHALAEYHRSTKADADRDIPVLDALQACYEAGRLIQRGERNGAVMGAVSAATDDAKTALVNAGRVLRPETGPDGMTADEAADAADFQAEERAWLGKDSRTP